MSNRVQFTIEGQSAGAEAAIRKVEQALSRLATNPGLAAATRLAKTFQTALHGSYTASRLLSTEVGKLNAAVRSSQTTMGRAVNGNRAYVASLTQANKALGQTNTAMRQQATQAASATRSVSAMTRAYQKLNTLASDLKANITTGGAALRGVATSMAGGVAMMGIGFRQSALAIGQQLGSIAGGALSGNIASSLIQGIRDTLVTGTKILTLAVEAGVRIATPLAGAFVKTFGAVLGAAVQIIPGVLASSLKILGGGGVGAAILFQGILTGAKDVVVTLGTFFGEAVAQIGNVFTGLSAIVTGAFEGAVNIVSSALNSLITVAQDVAGVIGGVLGTAGKAIFGTVGVIGGFAAKDIIQSEGTFARAAALLDPSVSAADREAMREWSYNFSRELGNIAGKDINLALERAISTGFQKNPEGARAAATAASKLAAVVGDEAPAEIARAMSKGLLVFGDEMKSKSDGTYAGAANLMADKLFAIKNFGDIDIGPLARRLGDLMGPARALNMTFDELVGTLSKLTLVQGVEQSFTGLAQMMETFKKIGPKGYKLLDKVGIETRIFSESEQKQLSAMMKEQDRLSKEALGTDKKRAKEAEKAAKALGEQIDEFRRMEGVSRPILELWGDLLRALESGKLNDIKLQKIASNIRASRSGLGLDVLRRVSPTESAAVDAGIAGAAGSVDRGLAVRQAEDIGENIGRMLKEIKQPFIEFWLHNRKAIHEWVEDAIKSLKRFNDWWKAALDDPGAQRFFDNLKGKLSSLFDFDLGEGITTGQFWDAMNAGLDKAWEIGKYVVDVFKDIGSAISFIGSQTGIFESLWTGGVTVFETMREVLGQMAKGDYSAFGKAWDYVESVVDSLITKLGTLFSDLVTNLTSKIKPILFEISAALESAANSMGSAMAGVLGYAAGGALFGGKGGGGGAGGPVMVPGGVGGGGGKGGGRFARFGAGAMNFGAQMGSAILMSRMFDLFSGAGQSSTGGTIANTLSGATTGFALSGGNPLGALAGAGGGLIMSLLGGNKDAKTNAQREALMKQLQEDERRKFKIDNRVGYAPGLAGDIKQAQDRVAYTQTSINVPEHLRDLLVAMEKNNVDRLTAEKQAQDAAAEASILEKHAQGQRDSMVAAIKESTGVLERLNTIIERGTPEASAKAASLKSRIDAAASDPTEGTRALNLAKWWTDKPQFLRPDQKISVPPKPVYDPLAHKYPIDINGYKGMGSASGMPMSMAEDLGKNSQGSIAAAQAMYERMKDKDGNINPFLKEGRDKWGRYTQFGGGKKHYHISRTNDIWGQVAGSGVYGSWRGSMGQGITEQGTMGGWGARTGGFRSPFGGGVVRNDPDPAFAQNKAGFQKTAQQQADKFLQAAEALRQSDPAAAATMEKAAQAFQEASNKGVENAKSNGEKMTDMAKTMDENNQKQHETTVAGLDALKEVNIAQAKRIDDLAAEVDKLRSLLEDDR